MLEPHVDEKMLLGLQRSSTVEVKKLLGNAIAAVTALAVSAHSCFADDGRPAGDPPGAQRTLAQVASYVVELTALKRGQLTRANIDGIVHGRFRSAEGRKYEQDFTLDEGFGINLLLVEHEDHELLEIELRPRLPMPKIIDQRSFDAYRKRLEEYAPIALKHHCIAGTGIAKSLHESGWTWFPTELSSSPEDDDGNIVYSSQDKGFVVLTLENSCLASIQISTESSYSGTYGKAVAH
jgi:hypothetical protein